VRWGRVYRSDHLGELTDEDLAAIDRLGVQVIIDYRGPMEHEMTPSRIPLDGPIERRDLAIGDGTVEGVSLWDSIVAGTLPSFGPEELTQFYLATLERSAAIFGEVIGLIADADRHALVFHCTAGKDRTGLTAALLLGSLGVSRGEILDDYELTNRFRSGHRVDELRPVLAEQGVDIDHYLALFVATRKSMADTLLGLEERYGSIDAYLTGPAGLTPAILLDLRQHLLAD
jgi:protein-tyrosine phosphatase